MKLIAALLIFYPLIIPVWHKGPITQKSVAVQQPLTFLTTSSLKFQFEKYKHIKDLRIKSNMLFEWGHANNPYAVSMFMSLLKEEKDDSLRADLLINLFAMRHIKKSGNSAIFTKFLSDSSDIIRAYSAVLYLDNEGDPEAVIPLLEKERSLFVLNLIFSQMREMPDRCRVSDLESLLNSEIPDIRAGSAGIIALQKGNPDASATLQSLCRDRSTEVTASLARELSIRKSGGEELLAKLAENRSSTVRAFVASAVPREALLEVYLKLSRDSDWEVRRCAALSLGRVKSSRSLSSLIRLLSDDISEVRDAAEKAIIEFSPDKDALKEIGDKVMPSLCARPYAITILGSLRDGRFAPQITNYLKSSSDNNIIYRSIVALDMMEYKKSEEFVRMKLTHTNLDIQKAAVHALGTFAMVKSFDSLIELAVRCMNTEGGDCDSRVIILAAEAVEAMGRIADPAFNTVLTDLLCNVHISSSLRAIACWSIARVNSPTKKITRQLQNLMLKKIIPTPDGKFFDADDVRISAALAMIDMSRKHSDLKDMITYALREMMGNQDEFQISNSLMEYFRQAALYRDGVSDITPAEVPVRSPQMTLKPIIKRSRNR